VKNIRKKTVVYLIAGMIIGIIVVFTLVDIHERYQKYMHLEESIEEMQKYLEDFEKAVDEKKEAVNLSVEAKQYCLDGEFSKAAIRYYDGQSHYEMAEAYSKAAMESAPTTEDKEFQKNNGMSLYYMSKRCCSYGEMCEELAKPQPNRELVDRKFNEADYYHEKAVEYVKVMEYAI
jgi:tetratricopeptide (TPR) repeat protein